MDAEVDVDPTLPAHHLLDPDLMRRLMERTGDGTPVSTRTLAKSVGVHHSFIGHLLTGERTTAPAEIAQRIAQRIGVDILVLFTPTGRTVPAPSSHQTPALTA